MSLPPDREAIKRIIIESLGLEGMTPADIGDEQPLFGDEGLGLDSIDALELIVVLEKDYGIVVDSEEVDPESFASVAALEQFVQQRFATGGEEPASGSRIATT
ncbi:MAG: acyl carrier protein [Acidobacteria bacterium]|nr:MAG: acyl carrier protein [Acidobacteriota bacterium]REK07107.1 MAG: acyl carrier protein [Acidobacteriota bacterium]